MTTMTDTLPRPDAAAGPATIALVDDDRNILASVSMTLEAEGFEVRTYVDGDSALRGLSARPADLAILDIKMPRMDGMELLSRLRRQSKMPVIFLTSKDDEVDEILGLRMGADDYIKKKTVLAEASDRTYPHLAAAPCEPRRRGRDGRHRAAHRPRRSAAGSRPLRLHVAKKAG